MSRTYYAASYPYGAGVRSSHTGQPIRSVYAFDTPAERDAWTGASPTDYITASGYRAPVLARELTAHERVTADMTPWPTPATPVPEYRAEAWTA